MEYIFPMIHLYLQERAKLELFQPWHDHLYLQTDVVQLMLPANIQDKMA